VSEIFESVQGEGRSAGRACTFLRLANCNLKCSWCDTKYTWDWTKHDRAREVHELSVKVVADQVRRSRTELLVVTGGEPLLQQPAIEALLEELGSRYSVEVETNGTLAPSPALSLRVSQWNVSPKLANSGEPLKRRLVTRAVQALLRTKNAWFKFVCEDATLDPAEVLDIARAAGIPDDRISLMPQAATRGELSRRSLPIVQESVRRGWGFSPRLHVQLWGGKRGC